MHFVTNVLMVRFALRKIKIPRLFQVPGPLHLESNIFRKLDIKSANEFDFWAPSCKKSEEIYLKEGISSSKVFLAYYGGYGGNTVEEYSESKNILHMQYNIPKENILIGMVSYFYKPKWYLGQTRGIKGHEDFIDAIEILNKTYKNITGIIMGGPWGKSYKYEEKIKKYVQDKKIRNIIFTGFRKDTKQIYRELNIVVHPSHSENLGGAAESLAAGVPTIATNIGGFPDIVIDGKTGYLCECKNPKSIANCVNKILNDKQKTEQMTVSGRETIKNLLDIENTAIRMKMIYQKILKRDKKVKIINLVKEIRL